MTRIRSFFLAVASIGMICAIVALAPASPYFGDDVLRVYKASPIDEISMPELHEFYLVETAVAAGEQPDTTEPDNYRSIDTLKPEYAAAMATDAQNFVEVRRRC